VIIPHQSRDYKIASFTFLCVTVFLTYDGQATTPLFAQTILAILAWTFLIIMLKGETGLVRIQVLIAVVFATIGENFASLYMEGYIYRLHNLPLYIPAGHGMVYLTAVALGRSGFFQQYASKIATFVVIIGSSWALFGISSYAERQDVYGAVLFIVFLGCLFKGRSPMVYLGAFFITSWLEIVGTYGNTWAWAVIDPATGVSQGNPPSGVAAWYCLVDAVAIAGAQPLWNKWKDCVSWGQIES